MAIFDGARRRRMVSVADADSGANTDAVKYVPFRFAMSAVCTVRPAPVCTHCAVLPRVAYENFPEVRAATVELRLN